MKRANFDTRSLRPSLSRRNSSYFKNPSLLRRKSNTPSPTSDTFSQIEAQWFLRLPDKIQKKHFTKEERSFLSVYQSGLAPEAAKSCREAARSVPSLRTSSFSSLSSLSTFEAEPFGSEQPVDSTAEMEGMIWFDDHNEPNLELDDYHQFINKAADSTVKSRKRGPSFRRALSLTSLPFGSNLQSSYPASPPPPVPPIPQEQHVAHSRRQSRAMTLGHNKNDRSSISTLESSAAHYQDPEARLKLRVYLASPQKFDEAIEFGFPSMDDKESLPLHRPSLQRNSKTAPCKTFLYDDQPSLIDALDDDEDSTGDTASLPDRNSPYTPRDSAFQDGVLLSPSIATSGSDKILFAPPPSQPSPRQMNVPLKPTIRHADPHEPFAQLLAGSREMTLRMTLTRPDLRADEKAIYERTTGDDPLALEHLPPAKKSPEEIWDSLPKETGIVRKLWRKVSGRA